MALNLKSLLTRKKKAAAEDGEEPFFTGATLGPGLDDGPAGDMDGPDDPAQNAGAADQPRGFADILDDEDWGSDLDDEDGAVLGHGARKRKRLAMLAGIGVVAALIAGGTAWWMLSPDPAADAPQMAAADAPAPSDPIGSGEKVSLPMPGPPGLDDVVRTKPAGEDTPPNAVLDPTAATDKSVARRPWLAQDGGTETAAAGTAEGEAAPAPAETAEAPAASAPTPAQSAEAETAEGPQAPAEQKPAPEAPSAKAPTETAAAAPDRPKIEEPELPDTRDKRPTPSFEELADAPAAEPLREAPVADLTRQTPAGPMPVPAPDGRKAWTTYAKPFQAPASTPRVAVVVAGLGMMPAATQAAIEKLPAGVTLAFSPYGFDLPQAMQAARAAGHEVLLTLPMEGRGFPANDPGPLGLNTLLPVNDNLIRLNTVMTKGIGYTGLIGRDGATLTANREIMAPVLEAIGRAGLLYVHPASGVEMVRAGGPAAVAPPSARVDLKLDERPFRGAVEARLKALEQIARERGSAVAVLDPTPLGYDALSAWLKTLPEKGLTLAPVSAVVRP